MLTSSVSCTRLRRVHTGTHAYTGPRASADPDDAIVGALIIASKSETEATPTSRVPTSKAPRS